MKWPGPGPEWWYDEVMRCHTCGLDDDGCVAYLEQTYHGAVWHVNVVIGEMCITIGPYPTIDDAKTAGVREWVKFGTRR